MKTGLDPVRLWLDIATNRIRFKPDRKAVRAELSAHLEDKALDLQRIFPDLSEEEAKERAAAGMGDPEEVGRELARLHKPWLGYLWRLSQLCLAVLVILFCWYSVQIETPWDDPFRGGYYEHFTAPQTPAPEQAELGGYTFRIVDASYEDYPEDSISRDHLQVTFQVSSPRFWAPVSTHAVQNALTLVGEDGRRWTMETLVVGPGQADEVPPPDHYFHLYSWGPFDRTFQAVAYLERPKWDRVTLEFQFELGQFALSADFLTREVEA